jgi:hypothetical protein
MPTIVEAKNLADLYGLSAGPPPWFVYRMTARAATALSILEPGGATRWRF